MTHKVGVVQLLVIAEEDWAVGRVLVVMQVVVQAKVVDAGGARGVMRSMQILVRQLEMGRLGRGQTAFTGYGRGSLDTSAVVLAS